MTSHQELLDDVFAIRWPLPHFPEDDQTPPHQRGAAVDAAWRPRTTFVRTWDTAQAEHGPD
ncbi:hypothetical protein, partial [Streptomyces sp. MK5]|uniref:hypothetical protein n=1 Tax=Streptomyces sp. MK5 TaxID=3064253 RepID=UPI0027426577